MATLILTLGTRDIRPKPESIAHPLFEHIDIQPDRIEEGQYVFADTRKAGQIIKESLDKGEYSYLDLLLFPIARPTFEYVLDETHISKVVYVFTDQDDPDTEEKFKRNDTLYLPTIVHHLARRTFKKRIPKSWEGLKVGLNPTLFEPLYDFFGKELARDVYQFTGDQVFLMAQSGVEACNLALFLQCLENYPQLTQMIKPAGFPTPIEVNTPERFQIKFSQEKILDAIQRYEYSAVIQNSYKEPIGSLASYAFSSLSFDFDRAKKTLAILSKSDPENLPFYRTLNQHLDRLRKNNQAKLEVLYLGAKMKYMQQAYADFLIRIFAMSEQMLLAEMERLTGIQDPYKHQDEWVKAIADRPSLKAFLDAQTYNKKPLYYSSPGFFVNLVILDWEEQETAYRSPVKDLSSRLICLRGFRNAIAHSFDGVNAEDLENALAKVKGVSPTDTSAMNQLFEDLDRLFELKGFGIYDRINQHIRAVL